MKILLIAVLLAMACMVAPVSQADSLEFARKSLGLEIDTELFGTSLTRFKGAEKVESVARPNGGVVDWTGVEWYRTKKSSIYERSHAGSSLRYGFKEGRLIAVHLRILGFDPNAERAARIKESISKMFADFKHLAGERLVYQDDSLWVLFTPFCNPAENLFAVILLGPPEKN